MYPPTDLSTVLRFQRERQRRAGRRRLAIATERATQAARAEMVERPKRRQRTPARPTLGLNRQFLAD